MKTTLVVLLAAASVRAADAPAAKPAAKPEAVKVEITEAAQPAEAHVKDTPKERKRVHAHFAAMDANHDGVIDAAEIDAFAAKTCAAAQKAGLKPDCGQVKAAERAELGKADEKHDGKITEDAYDRLEEPLEK